jgi:hypothetical protein
MVFKVRDIALPVCLCLMLLATIGIFSLQGCAGPLGGPGGKGPATTRAATKPTNETVSVELNVQVDGFVPVARGVLRPLPATALPADLLAKLGPMAHGRDGGGPPVLVTIGDVVKFDGAFPGDKKNWTKWDQGVEALIRKQQSDGRPAMFEVWKEPDNGRPFRDRLDFFGAWVHTTRLIRKIAPGTVMVGPGTQKFDGGWISEFLKVCKEYSVLPEIVSWHEDGLKHDLSGHVGNMGEAFWQDGSNIKHVIISPNAAIDNKQSPGDPAIYLGQMVKSIKDNAFRRIEQDFEVKLTHLFTNEMQPRSIYFTFSEYSSLARIGRSIKNNPAVVKVNSSGTVDGIAVWRAPEHDGKLLLGRNRSRVDAKQVLGTVTLQVKGVVGATLHVRASRIADSGTKASKGLEAALEEDFAVKNGEASIPLPGFATGDAYSVEFRVSSEAPSTMPATQHVTAGGTQGAPMSK